jgi:hypothetical protein
VLRKNKESLFALRLLADKHNSVHDGFAELQVRVVFKAVGQEFQQNARLARQPLEQYTHSCDRLHLEFKAQVGQVGRDLLEQLLHLLFAAGAQERANSQRSHGAI